MKSLGGAQGARHEATEAQHAKIRYLKYYTQHWQRLKNQVVLSLVHVTAEMNARTIEDLEAITGNANTQESGAVTVTTGGETPLGIGGTSAQIDARTGKTGVRNGGATTGEMNAETHQEQENLLGRDVWQATSPERVMTDQENSQEDVMTDREKGLGNDRNVHLQGVESVTNAAETVTWQETAKPTLTLTAVRSIPAITLEPRDSAALQSGSQILQTTRQPTLRLLHRLMTSFSHFPSQHLPWRQVRFQS